MNDANLAKEVPAIPSAVKRLSNAVDRIEKLIHETEQRVASVVRPASPKPAMDTKCEPPSAVALAGELQQITNKINASSDYLEDTLARLAI